MKHYIFKILFLLSFGFSGLVLAQEARIGAIRIHGNRALSNSKILNLMSLKKGSVFSEKAFKEDFSRILEGYKKEGFYFAQIDSSKVIFNKDSSKIDLEIFLREGPRLRIRDIQILGNNELLRHFESQRGDVFDEGCLERDISNIIERYENSGYPLCQVKLIDLEIDSTRAFARIQIKVDKGPLIRIGKIKVQGNELTKDNVVIRETGIRVGDLYCERKIDRIRTRLMRLGYFKSVEEPQILFNEQGAAELLIKVEEGGASSFDGVLGYNPSPGKKERTFTGLLNFSFRNLLGTGRRFDAYWEKKDRYSQQLRLYYREPWVLNLPLDLGLNFEQLIQDTTYIQRSWGLDLSLFVLENFTIISKIGKKVIIPDSLGSLIFQIPNSETLNLSLELSYDSRDDPVNPHRGIKYTTSMNLGRKRIKDQMTDNRRVINKRITLDFEGFLPLFRRQVLGLGLHGVRITSSEGYIPLEEQFRFGGARSLRGYRENQFRGSQIAWFNLEYRYLLGGRSRAFIFLDGGYYYRRERSGRSIEGWKLGYGCGVRVETRMGVIGVDYGLGEGDSFTNGKVHVSLMNEF